MVERKVLLHVALGVVTVALAVFAGVLIRYQYENADGDGADTSVYEVVAEGGQVYSALPVQPSDKQQAMQMRKVLAAEKIDSRMANGKLMVKPVDTSLSVDLLSAANQVRGTQHFTLSDVTADPQKEPRRFEAQNRLAVQNTLSKMIPVMSPLIKRAAVLIGRDNVSVTLWMSSGEKLPEQLRREIAGNVSDLVDHVKPADVIFSAPSGDRL